MKEKREEILRKIEGYMKFRNLSKSELAKEWGKTEIYVYRRLSGIVELGLVDILELCKILKLSKKEASDIFFNDWLRNA